ncbi:MAG TPA: hypothetical protein VGU74_04245 [Gemmatimonadales bacterium]|nr:hypothetical protein [Gemmatimonadales bacterium]
MTVILRFSTVVALGGLLLGVACVHDSPGPGAVACTGHGTDIALAVTAYQLIDPATDSGCVNFPANASATDSAEYLVLPQSGGGTPASSTPFLLRSATAVTAMVMPSMAAMGRSANPAHGPNAVAFDHFLRQMARTRDYPRLSSGPLASAPLATTMAGPPAIGNLRTFKVCATFTCSRFDNVAAIARSVGQHLAIYVDTLAPSPGSSTSDLDSLKRVFDSRLYPLDTATFGNVSDIDSNSVVIVLMTNTVNKLVSKTQCTQGFIAGFFFSGDLDPVAASQFNNGEIFYSIVADPNGTLSCAHSIASVRDGTGVTFTHEFQHMINFVEHVRVRGSQEEEGWLDEGLSKYAEEIAGRTYLPNDSLFTLYAYNDAYDAYQYLAATATTPLLIPADTGTLAEVGASWLFTRFIIDRFGDSLAGKLVESAQIGAANVAARTGEPFDVTIGHWGLANWVSDLPTFAAPAELQYTSWHFRTTFGSLHTQQPGTFPVAYPLVPPVSAGNAVNLSGKLWVGSGAYVRVVQPPGGAAYTLQFTANGSAPVSPALVPRLVVIRIR